MCNNREKKKIGYFFSFLVGKREKIYYEPDFVWLPFICHCSNPHDSKETGQGNEEKDSNLVIQ